MNTNQIPPEIESSLNAVRTRIRRVQAARAALIVATVMLGGLVVMMAVDHAFPALPKAARWAMFTGWILGLGLAGRFGLAPMGRPIGLVQVARWLEVRHPEIEERLSTVLELGQGGTGVSSGLLAALSEAAGNDAAKVDARLEVQAARTTRRWARPAIGLASMLLLAFVLWPQETSRLLVRAVAPFSNLGNAGAGRFTIHPGNFELIEGDRLELEVAYDGSDSTAELWMDFEDGSRISQPLAKEGGAFRYVLDPVKRGFRYHLRAGRNESDAFTATVWPLPALSKARAELQFPDYTGVGRQEVSLNQPLRAVAGTRVTLSGQTNTAIESAWLEVGGIRAAEATIESSSSGGRVTLVWTLEKPGSAEAAVKLRHRLGREVEALRFTLETLGDQAPAVVLLSPSKRDLKVRPDERLSMRYEVTEDFSVEKASVEVEAGDKSARFDQPLPLRVANAQPPRFRGGSELAVGALLSRFPGVREMRLRIRAEDGRPARFGGPGVGTSEWLKIHIDEGAESFARQELREEHEGAREEIQKAIQNAQEARDRMSWHREEVKQGKPGEQARKHFEEAGEKLATAREALADLSKRMQESVHASKADEVAKASDLLQQSRENLENSTAQDQPEQREGRLDQARNQAEAAVRQLEAVRNAMDRQREKIEDLARMEELAQQQRELARQAQANLQNRNEVPRDWKQKQEQAREAMRQQVQQRPDARAEAAKTQAEQTRELANQARELSKDQEELKDQAQQATTRTEEQEKEALQKAITDEQDKIQADAEAELAAAREEENPAADSLPKAAAAATRSGEQLRKNDLKQASEAAKESSLAMKEASSKAAPSNEGAASPDSENQGETNPAQAARKESLEQLAERQSQLAEAMESLAKGDQAKALQQLQEARAEEAADFSQTLAATPQPENSGAMQESRNSARQGSEQAQAAARQSAQPQRAAGQHEQAARNLEKSAQSLEEAARQFDQIAQQAAGQQPPSQQAAVSPADLAKAFQQAAEASGSAKPAEAAARAAEAADAMTAAAQSGRRSLQGQSPGKPGKPGQPGGVPGQPGPPGTDPNGDDHTPEADPGVPPELAKLGISAQDWEKIRNSLKSDVGASGGEAVPEEYRALVKGYFESMSKKTDGN